MNLSAELLSNVTNTSTIFVPGMSDAELVARYCGQQSGFLIIMFLLILALTIISAITGRRAKDHPEEENMRKTTEFCDTLRECFLFGVIAMQLGLWLLF